MFAYGVTSSGKTHTMHVRVFLSFPFYTFLYYELVSLLQLRSPLISDGYVNLKYSCETEFEGLHLDWPCFSLVNYLIFFGSFQICIG